MTRFMVGLVIGFCGVFGMGFGSGLKEVFKEDFLIGAALNRDQFYDKDVREGEIIRGQFNSITAENSLKWESVHPEVDVYDWEAADQFVRFGEENGMFIVGHTLIWHQQTPGWVFEDDQGHVIDRDSLLERMRRHIYSVVGRYKGKIHGWDVVNEALNNDGSLLESPWMKIIGGDYILKAFQFAHEADPDAQLYYNDYGLNSESKRAGAIDLIYKLRAKGVPIRAIGLQEHNALEWPSIKQVVDAIKAFSELGLKVHITELDVDVLPAAWHFLNLDLNDEIYASLNPYSKDLPASVDQVLTKRYTELFNLYLKYHEVIERVTLWGVSDRNSWLNDFPIKGRTNYPLLFDRNLHPKQAFDAIIALKKQG